MAFFGSQPVVFKSLGEPANGSKRGLDLMRDVGNEFLAHIFHLVQFERHFVHAVGNLLTIGLS